MIAKRVYTNAVNSAIIIITQARVRKVVLLTLTRGRRPCLVPDTRLRGLCKSCPLLLGRSADGFKFNRATELVSDGVG